MRVLIVDNGSTYLDQLKKLFSRHEVTVIPRRSIRANSGKETDIIVLSGGHSYAVAQHPEKFTKELSLIRQSKKPILGVCLGFELIAYAYGSTLTQMKKKEVGTIPIQYANKKYHVYENHRWVVTKIGPSLRPLARSMDGIEAIRHRTKPIYGFQFHPEMFVRKTDGKRLFNSVIQTLQP